MKIEIERFKEYITSAGEKAIDTGGTNFGWHKLAIGDDWFFYDDNGTPKVEGTPDIIGEWPKWTDAPEWHVNTAEIVYSKPVTQDEWNDWIGWNGGECPVGTTDRVEAVGIHDGCRSTYLTCEASHVKWTKLFGAYRTRKEPVMTTVTLHGKDYGHKWAMSPDLHDGDTHGITLVMKDGVPQSIANVEVIK